MKKIALFSSSIFLALLLSGCNGVRSSDVGLIGGAAAGGVIGSALTDSTAGTIVGAAAGAYAGHQIGKRIR